MTKKKQVCFSVGPVSGIILLVVLVAAAVLLPWNTMLKMDVLAVSQVTRSVQGLLGDDGEVKGGFWRVLADSRNSAVQGLKLDESFLNQYGVVPPDEVVRGKLDITVYQDEEPYYLIPYRRVGTYTVSPSAVGTYVGLFGPEKDTSMRVEPLKVSVWELVTSQKKLMIPFTVYAMKSFGENVSPLKCDSEEAMDQGGGKYRFELSYQDIAYEGIQRKYEFYNPLDPAELFEVTLQWQVGDYDRYVWGDKNFYVVTPEFGGPILDVNTFRHEALIELEKQLDYAVGYGWSYGNYWFGEHNADQDNAVFWGTYIEALRTLPINGPVEKWGDDGSPKGTVLGPTPSYGLLCEGYVTGSQTPYDLFQFPGWYTPAPLNGEGMAAGSDWNQRRWPLKPTVINNQYGLKPTGLSVCNYLAASDLYSSVLNRKHPAIPRVDWNIDFWGEHYYGNPPDDLFKYNIPLAARSWVFTLDVSTELVDTMMIVENYIDVEITGFELSPEAYDNVQAGWMGSATVTLHNKSPFNGMATVGASIPEGVEGSVTVDGGDMVFLEADQSKVKTLQFTNLGNLVEDEQADFRLRVLNDEGRETDYRTWSWTFTAGLGVQTVLNVETYDAESNQPLGGVQVDVYWGTDKARYASKTTLLGRAVFESDFGSWEGEVLLEAFDLSRGYIKQSKTVTLSNSDVNTEIFFLAKEGAGTDYGWLLWVIIACVAVVGFSTVLKKRRRIW